MGRKARRTAQADSQYPVPLPYVPEVTQAARRAAEAPPARPTRASQVLAQPRWLRMVLAAFFALMTALVVTPLVDIIYTDYFFSMDTRLVPALVSTGLGLLVYAVGWRLIVGAIGMQPPPRRAVGYFMVFGLVVTLVALALVVIGIATNIQFWRS